MLKDALITYRQPNQGLKSLRENDFLQSCPARMPITLQEKTAILATSKRFNSRERRCGEKMHASMKSSHKRKARDHLKTLVCEGSGCSEWHPLEHKDDNVKTFFLSLISGTSKKYGMLSNNGTGFFAAHFNARFRRSVSVVPQYLETDEC